MFKAQRNTDQIVQVFFSALKITEPRHHKHMDNTVQKLQTHSKTSPSDGCVWLVYKQAYMQVDDRTHAACTCVKSCQYFSLAHVIIPLFHAETQVQI